MAAAAARRIRVLVIDDSATVRTVLCRELAADPQLDVVGYARDGAEGVKKAAALQPDAITLDVQMPNLDGLAALTELARACPKAAIVMLSSLTAQGAQSTVRALELGAMDFVAKPGRLGTAGIGDVMDELRAKIKAAARARARGLPSAPPPAWAPSARLSWNDRIVVIAASTGGPHALRSVLGALPAETGVPILLVQHMPPGFTKALAQRLGQVSPLRVEEARPGSVAAPGCVLLAPGGFHMTVRPDAQIELNQMPPECGVRPAANVTMTSAAAVYGKRAIGVVLTGMGEDGTRGAGLIRAAGGRIIAQDEATSVVYGMPRSVVDAGLADTVAPLDGIARAIVRACTRPARGEAVA